MRNKVNRVYMPKMPLEISVKLTTSDEVLALRSKIESLQNELENMKKEHNRLEYLYRCECLVSMELSDLCRKNGIKFRRSLAYRPSQD